MEERIKWSSWAEASEWRSFSNSRERRPKVPILYDWFANHKLGRPSLSCRWGPRVKQTSCRSQHRLYFAEQTDGCMPDTLVIANVDVAKPRIATSEHISKFAEDASRFMRKYKTIVHPGKVNRIRELPQNSNIVATLTNSPYVLIWNVDAQPNREANNGASNSRPDLILTGLQENANFALAMCHPEPLVLSGGKDKSVLLWSIQDQISSLAESSSANSPGSTISSGNQPVEDGNEKNSDSLKIGPRGVFQGHQDTVEDVQFRPSSAQEFCSVGDDSCLIFWDARGGTSPAMKVENHGCTHIHCVDWNCLDENYILIGSADYSVQMFDRRKPTLNGVGSPVDEFVGHCDPVTCVQWSPDKASVFGSAAEDGFLNIWDHDKVGWILESGQRMIATPPGLFFRHVGTRERVYDFHWNTDDPWTIVSVSYDSKIINGGGTLQIWRMSDLIYRPVNEVLEELDKFKSHILGWHPPNGRA